MSTKISFFIILLLVQKSFGILILLVTIYNKDSLSKPFLLIKLHSMQQHKKETTVPCSYKNMITSIMYKQNYIIYIIEYNNKINHII